jgi:hypothetical protein
MKKKKQKQGRSRKPAAQYAAQRWFNVKPDAPANVVTFAAGGEQGVQ